jgi:hypothetical protein
MGVDMAMTTSRNRHPRSGDECAFRARGDRRLHGLQADCCLSQAYKRTVSCTADEMYVRLSLLILASRSSVLDLVHIGLLFPILLRLSRCLLQYGICRVSTPVTVRHCCCANSVDADGMLGFCHYNSSPAFPDDSTRVLCAQLSLYRGWVEKQALASHHGGSI